MSSVMIMFQYAENKRFVSATILEALDESSQRHKSRRFKRNVKIVPVVLPLIRRILCHIMLATTSNTIVPDSYFLNV